jgi:hypothetical protein
MMRLGRMNRYSCKGIYWFFLNWLDHRCDDLLHGRGLWFRSRMAQSLVSTLNRWKYGATLYWVVENEFIVVCGLLKVEGTLLDQWDLKLDFLGIFAMFRVNESYLFFFTTPNPWTFTHQTCIFYVYKYICWNVDT